MLAKKCFFMGIFTLLSLSVALTGTAKADLVGWWRFDEGSGTSAADSSGRDMHGVLVNDPIWREDGVHKECLFFDGDLAHVRITHQNSLNPAAGSFTVVFWAYLEPAPGTTGSTNWDLAVVKRDAGSVGYYVGADRNQGNADQSGYRFMLGDTDANRKDTAFVAVPLGEWVFVVAVLDRDQNAQKISVDGGQTWATTTPPPGPIAPAQDLGIGWDIGQLNFWFHGRIDDVRVYNHALMEGEILAAMEGGEGYPYALGPNPSDGALHSDTWASISWIAGDYAVSHDVYLGDNFDDVNSGAEGTFQGNQAGTDFVAGFPGFPYPDGLIPGTTYYWRVDEVNDTEPNSPWKGKIWSFSIPPKTAYNPEPAESATFIDPNADLSWTPGFGAKLHTVYFGENFDDVNEASRTDPRGVLVSQNQKGTIYEPAGFLEFAQTYYWRVDEFNDAEPNSPWKGTTWTFTIIDRFVVDDFEDYTDFSPNIIYETWLDGWEAEANGSTVGYSKPPAAEQSIVHGGRQSMPFFYDNSGTANYSEAERSFSPAQDWTREGVGILSLWFRGHPAYVGGFTEGPTGTYTMTATGTDIWGNSDEFHFAWKEASGAVSISAKVESVENTDPFAKAGVMIRDTLEADSRNVALLITPENGVRFQFRNSAGGVTDRFFEEGITAPQWVKLERTVGGLVRAYYSADGNTWTQLNLTTVSMNTPLYIGLALTSHNTALTCEAKFSNVTSDGTGQWVNQDIGMLSNEAEPMYVSVEDGSGTSATVYHDDPDAALINTWTEWNIDLQEFSDAGIVLTDVSNFAIGFGGGDDPQPGGSGLMFFDDIRLYRAEP